jgi:hypothetical protein
MILFWLLPVFAVAHAIELWIVRSQLRNIDRTQSEQITTAFSGRGILVMNIAFILACCVPPLLNPRLGIVLWLFLASIILFNAVAQLWIVIKNRKYSAGSITSVFLNLPIAMIGYWHFLTLEEMSVKHGAMIAFATGLFSSWLFSSIRSRQARKTQPDKNETS